MTCRQMVMRDLPFLRKRLQSLRHVELLQMADIYGEQWDQVRDKSGFRQAFASITVDDPSLGVWSKLERIDGELVSIGFVWRKQQ